MLIWIFRKFVNPRLYEKLTPWMIFMWTFQRRIFKETICVKQLLLCVMVNDRLAAMFHKYTKTSISLKNRNWSIFQHILSSKDLPKLLLLQWKYRNVATLLLLTWFAQKVFNRNYTALHNFSVSCDFEIEDRLALENQKFPVPVRLLVMCRGELSAVIAWLIYKYLWTGLKW